MGGTPDCPRDVIRPPKNWKTPPLGHSQAPPPPLDIARVTSSTYSKGGTKLLKGGTKLLKGGTKSLGWATGGGVVRPPPPHRPPPLATGLGLHNTSQNCKKKRCSVVIIVIHGVNFVPIQSESFLGSTY